MAAQPVLPAQVDLFASTHTCLPALRQVARTALPEGWVLNNGAAGMPNFRGDDAGLLTRFALRPFEGAERRFGVRCGEVFIDAIAVESDASTWRAEFQRLWPAGSDAHASYFDRMARGPDYDRCDAVRD